MTMGDSISIANLNDNLRVHRLGGRVVITRGVQIIGLEKVTTLLDLVADFDRFDSYNDPWGEHDCGTINFEGDRYLWKIDYYDPSMTYRSPDPSVPELTNRVLTIMRSDEY